MFLYCLSASAERDGTEYIAVVLHADTSTERFDDAKTLLNYAFANYTLVNTTPENEPGCVPVKLGREKTVQARYAEHENLVCPKQNAEIRSEVHFAECVNAPVKAGDKLGEVHVYNGEERIMTYDIVASCDVERMNFPQIVVGIIRLLFGGKM